MNLLSACTYLLKINFYLHLFLLFLVRLLGNFKMTYMAYIIFLLDKTDYSEGFKFIPYISTSEKIGNTP